MDTSTSTNQIEVDRFDFLCNGLCIDPRILTPKEWLKLLEISLDCLSGTVNYLPYVFATDDVLAKIGDSILFDTPDPDCTVVRSERNLFLSPATRLVYISRLFYMEPHQTPGLYHWSDDMEDPLVEKFLFIIPSERNRWVVLTRQLRKRGDPVTLRPALMKWDRFCFSFPTSEELPLIIGTEWRVWSMLIRHLVDRIDTAIAQKQGHISKLESKREEIAAILARIS